MKISKSLLALKFNFIRAAFLLFSNKDRCITLIGEKGGNQARDNGFAYFQHRIKSGDKCIFFVYSDSNIDKKSLLEYKKNVVCKNSIKHICLFLRSKYLILNDGYEDVCPSIKDILYLTSTPFIYLQHGIIRYKRVFFNSSHYNGRVIRFVVSAKWERDIVENKMAPEVVWQRIENNKRFLWRYDAPFARFTDKRDVKELVSKIELHPNTTENEFKITQKIIADLNYVGIESSRIIEAGLPRHPILIEKTKSSKRRKNVLIFFTWRDYWVSKSNNISSPLIDAINDVISCESFIRFIEEKNYQLRIYSHHKSPISSKDLNLFKIDGIEIVNNENLQQIIADSALLITDYSSIAFDFLITKKPVLYYQFDRDFYDQQRGSYFTEDESWFGVIAKNKLDLYDTFSPQSERYKRLLHAPDPKYVLGRDENIDPRPILDSEISNIPKRVCFICYNIYGVGGTVRAVTNLANALVKKGYPISIISVMRTSENPSMGLHPGVNILSLIDKRRGKKKSFLRSVLELIPSFLISREDDFYANLNLYSDIKIIEAIRSCDADFLIPTFPGAALLAVRLRRKKTKCIIQEHKFLDAHPFAIKRKIIKIYPKADGLLNLTQLDAKEYQKIGCKNTLALGNGTEPIAAQQKPTLKNIKKIVLGLGRLDKVKQFDLLIESFLKASHGRDNWELHIYGNGPEEKVLRNLADRIDSRGLVKIFPATNDVTRVLNNAEIYTVTSKYEGFGMTIIEAYALSKPVLTFDIERGPKEIVVDNFTGLKAKPFDTDEYAKLLIQLMDDPLLRRDLGRKGHELFLKNFESNSVASRFEDFIKGIADEQVI